MANYQSTHTGAQIDTALNYAEIFGKLGYTVTTSQVINGTTYQCIWTTAPTSSNQIYGLTLSNGRLYRVYNNKGSYSVLNYDYDSNTTTAAFGKIATAAGIAAKTASFPRFELYSGQVILIWNTIANTIASALTLNVNSTGAKPIYLGGSASSSSNYSMPVGYYLAEYDGTNWKLTRVYWTDSGGLAYSGISSAASGSTTQTVNMPGFALYTGQRILCNLNATNAATTLNVNSQGAKTLRQGGSAISSTNAVSAGWYVLDYDGTYWNIDFRIVDSNDGCAARAKKLETYKANDTGTYDASYPLYAKWDSGGTKLDLVCDGYSVRADELKSMNISQFTNDSNYVVTTDSRLSDSRNAKDVYSWAKAANRPSYSFSEISSRGEALLGWGGDNKVGSVTPIGMSLSNEHSANRAAFINGDCITMEYSSDAGATWTDYGYSSSAKSQFFTQSYAIPVGRTSGEYSTNSRTRITLTAQNGTTTYMYTNPRKMLINVASSGSMEVLVEVRTGTNYKSGGAWTTFGTYSLSGWSGWNDIPLVLDTLGGGASQTGNNWQLRLTFIMKSKSTEYPTTAQVNGVRIYGENDWGLPSNFARTGHIYTFDMSQNVNFPASVYVSSNKKVATEEYVGTAISTAITNELNTAH